MAASVTHAKVSTVPDGADPDDVLTSDWNAAHTVSITAADVGASSTTLVGTATNVQGVLEELDDAVATDIAALATHAAAADPHTVYQLESELRAHQTFSKQGVLVTTTDSTALRWHNRSGRTLTFTMVELACVTAPTGAAILVDVNIGGTTIFSTQGNRPTIAISGNEGNTTTFNTTTIADGSYLTVNIDQVGSSVAGTDLTVTVWMKG